MDEVMTLSQINDLDVSCALIQALIPVGLKAVNEKLQQEIKTLAGERYRHGKETVRWGAQGGLGLPSGSEGADASSPVEE